MEFNIKRFFTGIILLLVILFFFYFKYDIYFISFLSFLIVYDLVYSKILKINFSILLILILSLIFYQFKDNLFFYFIFPLTVFITIYIKSYRNFFFILNLILFIFFCTEMSIIDRSYLYYIILLSFVNDTSAYIFGRFLKGPKITPIISPNKTYSGTIISSIISYLLILFLFDLGYMVSFVAAISFFIGDIYFSFIKRKYFLKDFSNLLSGHGGILDRLDSIFFCTYLLLFYFKIH